MADPHEIRIRSFLVSAFLMRGKGPKTRTLLMKRSGPRLAGIWCQVAGNIDPGETAWQAALREIREETGITPSRFYSSDLCEQFYEQTSDSITLAPVFVGLVPDEVDVMLNEEHSEFGWFTLDEAQERLTFAGQRDIVATIWREFVDRKPTRLLEIEIP